MGLWIYEHNPHTMDIELYYCDLSKIGQTCKISNNAHCEVLQMLVCSLGPPYEEPGNYSEWVKVA